MTNKHSDNKKNNRSYIVIGIVLAAIISAIAFATTLIPSNKGLNNVDNQKEIIAKLLTPSIESAYALGKPDAKVTIVEFGDYQCTYCARFHKETRDAVLKNFVSTGKARFLFKDFTLNDLAPSESDKLGVLARASSLAAIASYCAADQGKFWEYHDQLYNNWKGENNGWVTRENLDKFTYNVNLGNMKTFSSCLDSGKYSGVVKDNTSFAQNIGLDATPFFILYAEGKQPVSIRGAYPYAAFENAINQLYLD